MDWADLARLGSARLGPARPGSARLCSPWLGQARLGLPRLGAARLGSPRLASARRRSARPSPAQLLVPVPAAWCPCALLGALAPVSGASQPGTSLTPFLYSGEDSLYYTGKTARHQGERAPDPDGTQPGTQPGNGLSRPGSIRPGPARLGSAGRARLGSARPGPARLASARPDPPRLGPARPGSVSSAQLGSARHGQLLVPVPGARCPCPLLGALALVSGAPQPGTHGLMSHSHVLLERGALC